MRITAYYKSTIRARTLPHTGSYCGNSTAVLQRKAVATAGELVMEVPRLSTVILFPNLFSSPSDRCRDVRTFV